MSTEFGVLPLCAPVTVPRLQAVMELGATVCTPTSPSCATCPISMHCKALALQRLSQSQLQPKSQSQESPSQKERSGKGGQEKDLFHYFRHKGAEGVKDEPAEEASRSRNSNSNNSTNHKCKADNGNMNGTAKVTGQPQRIPQQRSGDAESAKGTVLLWTGEPVKVTDFPVKVEKAKPREEHVAVAALEVSLWGRRVSL